MKNLALALLFMLGFSAFAEVIPCQTDCVAKVAVPYMAKAVIASSIPNHQDASCPNAGFEIVQNIAATQGAVVSSAGIIKTMIDQSQGQFSKFSSDKSHCGACKETNLITTFTTSAPSKTIGDSNCYHMPTENIQKELDNSEIENYANQTLQGNTPEGQHFLQICPKTCSFYVASAQTPTGPQRSRLNLTVMCNDKRQGAILFATYNYSLGAIHQWSCAK
jgi:hypothetical protein